MYYGKTELIYKSINTRQRNTKNDQLQLQKGDQTLFASWWDTIQNEYFLPQSSETREQACAYQAGSFQTPVLKLLVQ